MEKIFVSKLIFVMSLLGLSTFFVGCQDEEKENVKEEEKYVYVSPTSLTFLAEGGSQTISLSTNTTVWFY